MSAAARPGFELSREERLKEVCDEIAGKLEQTFLKIAHRRTNVLVSGREREDGFAVPRSELLGAYTCRGAGVSGFTGKNLDLLKLVHKLGRMCDSSPTPLQYCSVQLTQVEDQTMLKPHADAQNDGDSHLIAVGNFKGGRLWVQHPQGQSKPPGAKAGDNSKLGAFFDVQRRWICFDASCPHAVEKVSGYRVSLAFFVPRHLERLSMEQWAALIQLGFPCHMLQAPCKPWLGYAEWGVAICKKKGCLFS